MKRISMIFVFSMILISNQAHAQDGDASGEILQRHLLFKWKEAVDAKAQQEVLNLFNGLPDKIEGFEAVSIYTLQNPSEDFDILLVLSFESEVAMRIYEDHADHLRIKESAPTLIARFIAYDFWK